MRQILRRALAGTSFARWRQNVVASASVVALLLGCAIGFVRPIALAQDDPGAIDQLDSSWLVESGGGVRLRRDIRQGGVGAQLGFSGGMGGSTDTCAAELSDDASAARAAATCTAEVLGTMWVWFGTFTSPHNIHLQVQRGGDPPRDVPLQPDVSGEQSVDGTATLRLTPSYDERGRQIEDSYSLVWEEKVPLGAVLGEMRFLVQQDGRRAATTVQITLASSPTVMVDDWRVGRGPAVVQMAGLQPNQSVELYLYRDLESNQFFLARSLGSVTADGRGEVRYVWRPSPDDGDGNYAIVPAVLASCEFLGNRAMFTLGEPRAQDPRRLAAYLLDRALFEVAVALRSPGTAADGLSAVLDGAWLQESLGAVAALRERGQYRTSILQRLEIVGDVRPVPADGVERDCGTSCLIPTYELATVEQWQDVLHQADGAVVSAAPSTQRHRYVIGTLFDDASRCGRTWKVLERTDAPAPGVGLLHTPGNPGVPQHALSTYSG